MSEMLVECADNQSPYENDFEFTTPVRCEDLWFEDGSVVLSALSHTCTPVMFKVHRSVLSNVSVTFKEMFSFPQPEVLCNGEDLVEGCQVIPLFGDLSGDVGHLLKCLYEPLYFEQRIRAPLEDAVLFVAGVLRLAHKYDIVAIRWKCIRALEKWFPTTLTEFDARMKHRASYTPDVLFHVIAVAQQTSLSAVLPSALYLACNLPLEVILRGGKTFALQEANQHAVLLGREQLVEAQRMLPCSFLFTQQVDPALLQGNTCHPHCLWELTRALWSFHREGFAARPTALESFGRVVGEGMHVGVACLPCLQKALKVHEQGRKLVWARLPELFHLGNWESVKEEQKAASALE